MGAAYRFSDYTVAQAVPITRPKGEAPFGNVPRRPLCSRGTPARPAGSSGLSRFKPVVRDDIAPVGIRPRKDSAHPGGAKALQRRMPTTDTARTSSSEGIHVLVKTTVGRIERATAATL
jgi:hypothetical protein